MIAGACTHAPSTWNRDDRAACGDPQTAVICVSADPDPGSLVFAFGGSELLPGECASHPATDDAVRGKVEVRLLDRDHRQREDGITIRVRAGAVTRVVAHGEPTAGEVDVTVEDCPAEPPQ